MKKKPSLVSGILLIALLLGACSISPPANLPVSDLEMPSLTQATLPNGDETRNPIETQVSSTPSQVPVLPSVEATQQVNTQATVKPVKTELEASDPTTVNLASGKIQLVEFFAFW